MSKDEKFVNDLGNDYKLNVAHVETIDDAYAFLAEQSKHVKGYLLVAISFDGTAPKPGDKFDGMLMVDNVPTKVELDEMLEARPEGAIYRVYQNGEVILSNENMQ